MLQLSGLIPRIEVSVPVYLFVIYTVCLTPIFTLLYIELRNRNERARQPRGCRKLGLKSCSNLADEHDYTTQGVKKQSRGVEDKKKPPKIKALIVYPIKSCAGVELNFADGTDTGLLYDRQFAFAEYVEPAASKENDGHADGQSGTGRWDCKTLRDGKFSRMALVRSEIWVPDPSSSTYNPKSLAVRSRGVLVISYPRIQADFWTRIGMKLGLSSEEEFFQVPLFPPEGKYPRNALRVFKDTPDAYNLGVHVPSSLATFLGTKKPLSLFRLDPDVYRPVRGNVPSEAEVGFKVNMALADEYPVQMQNLASIRDMAEKVEYAIPRFSVRRFRPNIVLEGLDAFDEDDWKRMRVVPGPQSRISPSEQGKEKKPLDIIVACRTVRCRLPNVDPDTGERHLVEPDKTLRAMREIDDGAKKKGCLGMMLVPTAREFTLHVGDEVQLLERGEHRYIEP